MLLAVRRKNRHRPPSGGLRVPLDDGATAVIHEIQRGELGAQESGLKFVEPRVHASRNCDEAILCDVPSTGKTDFDRLASICEMSVGVNHDNCSDIVSHRSVIMSSLDRGVSWFTSA